MAFTTSVWFFECLISGALYLALNAYEKGERFCIKVVGQDKMQDDRRERTWGLHLMELDRECFYVLLKLSMGWDVGEGKRVRTVYLENEPENVSESQQRKKNSTACVGVKSSIPGRRFEYGIVWLLWANLSPGELSCVCGVTLSLQPAHSCLKCRFSVVGRDSVLVLSPC